MKRFTLAKIYASPSNRSKRRAEKKCRSDEVFQPKFRLTSSEESENFFNNSPTRPRGGKLFDRPQIKG